MIAIDKDLAKIKQCPFGIARNCLINKCLAWEFQAYKKDSLKRVFNTDEYNIDELTFSETEGYCLRLRT